MGQGYIITQLVILIGLLAVGFYIIFTEDMIKPKAAAIEESKEATETIAAEALPEIRFVQVICTSCSMMALAEECKPAEDGGYRSKEEPAV